MLHYLSLPPVCLTEFDSRKKVTFVASCVVTCDIQTTNF